MRESGLSTTFFELARDHAGDISSITSFELRFALASVLGLLVSVLLFHTFSFLFFAHFSFFSFVSRSSLRLASKPDLKGAAGEDGEERDQPSMQKITVTEKREILKIDLHSALADVNVIFFAGTPCQPFLKFNWRPTAGRYFNDERGGLAISAVPILLSAVAQLLDRAPLVLIENTADLSTVATIKPFGDRILRSLNQVLAERPVSQLVVDWGSMTTYARRLRTLFVNFEINLPDDLPERKPIPPPWSLRAPDKPITCVLNDSPGNDRLKKCLLKNGQPPTVLDAVPANVLETLLGMPVGFTEPARELGKILNLATRRKLVANAWPLESVKIVLAKVFGDGEERSGSG